MAFVVEVVERVYAHFPHLAHHATEDLAREFYQTFVHADLTQPEIASAVLDLQTAGARDFPINATHIVGHVRDLRKAKSEAEDARARAALREKRAQDGYLARLKKWDSELAAELQDPNSGARRQRLVEEARSKYPHLYR